MPVVQQVRCGALPALRGYKGGQMVYQRPSPVWASDFDLTARGMQVHFEGGVLRLDGSVTGNLFVRLSNSMVYGSSATDMADTAYVLAPANQPVRLKVRQCAGRVVSGMPDCLNIVLRDNTNAATMKCMITDGVLDVSGTAPKDLSVLCLFVKDTTAENLVLELELVVGGA